MIFLLITIFVFFIALLKVKGIRSLTIRLLVWISFIGIILAFFYNANNTEDLFYLVIVFMLTFKFRVINYESLGVIYMILLSIYLLHDENIWLNYIFISCFLLKKNRERHRTILIFSILIATTIYLHIFSLDILKNILIYTKFGLLIELSIALLEYFIHDARRLNYVIAVAGDSGSGKTTFSQFLNTRLNKHRSVFIEGDGLHRWERGNSNWRDYTHLDPKANELHKQLGIVERLKFHRSAEGRDYLHSSGTFSKFYTIKPKEFVVLIGLHSWYLPRMREMVDLKIYLDTEETLRRHWKIIRDMQGRGYSREKVISQIESRVEDANVYIQPQKEFADILIRIKSNTGFDVGIEVEDLSLSTEFHISTNFKIDNELNKYCSDNNWQYSKNMQYFLIDLKGVIGDSASPAHNFFETIFDKIILYKDAVNNRFR